MSHSQRPPKNTPGCGKVQPPRNKSSIMIKVKLDFVGQHTFCRYFYREISLTEKIDSVTNGGVIVIVQLVAVALV